MTFQSVNSLFSWFIATEWKQFSTIYALCFTGVCVALQIAPLLNTLSTEADVHGAQKVLSDNGFLMANCFCCLSQNAMVCLAHCRQEWQQRSWKTARLFLQDRDQDQMFKTKTFIFVLEAPRVQHPGLEDYITDYNDRPALFPGRCRTRKATKRGLVLFSWHALVVLLLIRAPFYVLLILVAMCLVFWLF